MISFTPFPGLAQIKHSLNSYSDISLLLTFNTDIYIAKFPPTHIPPVISGRSTTTKTLSQDTEDMLTWYHHTPAVHSQCGSRSILQSSLLCPQLAAALWEGWIIAGLISWWMSHLCIQFSPNDQLKYSNWHDVAQQQVAGGSEAGGSVRRCVLHVQRPNSVCVMRGC